MAAYVKQADQIVLMFTKAEAIALRDIVQFAEMAEADQPMNNSTRQARDRAVRTISVACETGSRSGAAIY